VNFAIAATVFPIICLGELPDKTMFTSLVMASRGRPLAVWFGAAAAFTVHVGLAIAAGSLIGLLPHRALEITVSVLFAAGAALLLRGRHEESSDEHVELHGEPGFWKVAWTGFAVIAVAEFGDLTQVATATLAARYHDPLAVGVGAVLGLWAVGALAIVGGRQLLRVVPFKWITRVAAVVMIGLAIASLIAAITG